MVPYVNDYDNDKIILCRNQRRRDNKILLVCDCFAKNRDKVTAET